MALHERSGDFGGRCVSAGRSAQDAAPDGYSSARGGLVEFVSAVVGTGRGVERPNVDAFFPYGVDRRIVVIYCGAGARVSVRGRLDAFADWRLNMTGDDAAK